MTTIHFPVELPLPGKLPPTGHWQDSRPLRLDGHSLGGMPLDDRPIRYAPISVAVHAVILVAFLLGPLFGEMPAPEPALGLRAFFAEPGIVAPPPPPPPAAPPRAAAQTKAPAPIANPNAFVAPVEVPDQIARPSLSFAEGGVAGGVEGGVEGGVAGGIVGGLPAAITLARPEAPVVRVGGAIRAPTRITYVAPEYPTIASQAGVAGMVILEARVGTDGHVREATVLRGQPLFDDPARAAVLQWRYQPLLLNGVAMEFILTVTVQFSLRPPE